MTIMNPKITKPYLISLQNQSLILNQPSYSWKLVTCFLLGRFFLIFISSGNILFPPAHTQWMMSHIISRWVRPDGVLCSEGDAAHGDDGQDAELEILQSQDVVTALAKPGANTQTHTCVDTWKKTAHTTKLFKHFQASDSITLLRPQ